MLSIRSGFDALLGMSPEELIGAIAIAVALSFAMTGVYSLMRRRVRDTSTVITCLILFANVTCMVVTAAYIFGAHRDELPPGPSADRRTNWGPPRHGGFGVGPGAPLTGHIFAAADANKDGRLAPDEAANAAAQLVREADADKQGAISPEALGEAISRTIGPPPGLMPRIGQAPAPGLRLADLVAAADADKDGRLSPEEAAAFVRKAARDKGAVDETDLDAALLNHRAAR
jgi:hypothetical protein